MIGRLKSLTGEATRRLTVSFLSHTQAATRFWMACACASSLTLASATYRAAASKQALHTALRVEQRKAVKYADRKADGYDVTPFVVETSGARSPGTERVTLLAIRSSASNRGRVGCSQMRSRAAMRSWRPNSTRLVVSGRCKQPTLLVVLVGRNCVVVWQARA